MSEKEVIPTDAVGFLNETKEEVGSLPQAF